MRTRIHVVALALALLGVSLSHGANAYPEGARGFAGMISGVVVGKGDDRLAVQVTKIERVWKHSKAVDPAALVGKTVNVKLNAAIYAKKAGYLDHVRKFFGLLKAGDADSFDVKHAEGSDLIFLELTEAQMQRVKGSAHPPS